MFNKFFISIVMVTALCCLALQPAAEAASKGKEDTKISPHISAVVELMSSMGITKSNVGEFEPRSLSTQLVKVNDEGDIQAYIYVEDVNESNLNELEGLGVAIELANDTYNIVQGWVPFDGFDAVAALDFVIKITTPSYGTSRAGSIQTEGDAVMGSDDVRSMLGIDGTGVLVGAISNGVDNMAAAMASGDLPGGILVNPALSGGGDEGTAMLEIIHDIAPGAGLAFSGGFAGLPTSLEFVESVDFLVNAGAHVIVDDVGYFLQPYFQDGMVALAAEAAVAQGVVFVSAAGNDGLAHYQGFYVDNDPMDDTPFVPDLNPGNLHDFGLADGGLSDLEMSILTVGELGIILQWDDEFGQSSNDYDLIVLDADTLLPFVASVNPQQGNEDPIEFVSIPPLGEVRQFFILIDRFSGAPRTLEVFFNGPVFVQTFNVPGDSIFGHPAAPNVLGIGAVPATGDMFCSDAANPNQVESFSSRGPSTISFPAPVERQTPAVVAPDGNHITGAGGFGFDDGMGGFVFCGTSASAPHAAGVAALVLEADPALTPFQVGEAIRDTAVDISDGMVASLSGNDAVSRSLFYDPNSGFGRIDAFAAVEAVTPEPSPSPSPSPTVDGNGCSLASTGSAAAVPLYLLLPAVYALGRRWRLRKSA
ncbi:MAG: S8 family serine peptidase [Candidatus Dadabacteria bacterium]|nr:S8 family serine peptidase [Candidatus Dadabacteria bacterium]